MPVESCVAGSVSRDASGASRGTVRWSWQSQTFCRCILTPCEPTLRVSTIYAQLYSFAGESEVPRLFVNAGKDPSVQVINKFRGLNTTTQVNSMLEQCYPPSYSNHRLCVLIAAHRSPLKWIPSLFFFFTSCIAYASPPARQQIRASHTHVVRMIACSTESSQSLFIRLTLADGLSRRSSS